VVCAREFVPINARVHTGCNLSMYTRVILSNEARVHARVRAFGDVKSASVRRDRPLIGNKLGIQNTLKLEPLINSFGNENCVLQNELLMENDIKFSSKAALEIKRKTNISCTFLQIESTL